MSVMETGAKYREYAEECKSLAERAAPKDKSVLLEIADAWEKCAIEAERMERIKRKGLDGKGDAGEPANRS
jgi:hypothetical protein